MRRIVFTVTAAFAALGLGCSPGSSPDGDEIRNASESEDARVFVDLDEDVSGDLFLTCEHPAGCNISFGAELAAPEPCDLIDAEACGAACEGEECGPFEVWLATLAVEDPAGDVHTGRVLLESEGGVGFETRVDGLAGLGQAPGTYEIDLARSAELGVPIELAIEARWESADGGVPDAAPGDTGDPDADPGDIGVPDAAVYPPDAEP